ncbi:MAG: transporter substrate-binding domain-containing protein [Planctomycetes bacterium]|nr:transporter substrate-binding domain-containing protein [Planctomycetota bacterium]
MVKQDVERLTGLDVQLVRAVFAQMGYSVSYDKVSWRQHQLDVKNGARDIAAGAFKNPERAEYAYFSAPYRKEADVLYVRSGEADRYEFNHIDELLTRFREQKFRLGVIKGFYYGPDIMRFINDPANASLIVAVLDDVANFENLLDKTIDGFIADRLVGSTLAWRHGWQLAVEEVSPPVYSENIHVIFSKKTTTPKLVEDFNRSLHRLRQSGQYGLIIREYLFPALLGATVGQRWFFVIDILGTIAFAISGILLARQGGYSLFGAFVLASLPAMGGGIIRDLVVNREKLAVLANPAYLFAVIFTVLVGYLVSTLVAKVGLDSRKDESSADGDDWFVHKISVNAAIAFFDALGLAAFSIIGVVVAVESRSNPLWLWGPLLAALTGAGGGIIRDVIRADANNPFLKGTFYAEVALIWGLALSLFLTWYANLLDYKPAEISLAVIVALTGALLTRVVVFYFKVKSPMY